MGNRFGLTANDITKQPTKGKSLQRSQKHCWLGLVLWFHVTASSHQFA